MSDVYKDLKKIAMLLEKHVNNRIHQELNKEEVIQFITQWLNKHPHVFQSLREYGELLSAPLNIPTKTDTANIAKLLIQLEEKVDTLEDNVNDLHEKLDKVSVKEDAEGASEQNTKQKARRNLSPSKQEKAQRRRDALDRLKYYSHEISKTAKTAGGTHRGSA
ncbi:hypothetical protein SAMN05192534_10817 [Alteribacillus persepolensis]|uniref:Uncharacterized protein n=1 Tax=Alteribacillus persepolensis TaxID=568899 RepID=A0A1G8DT24_9BACI|nr:hypothetical protein [Alteribacillus persepolensis]SDH60856.1 hypothetical protein SAMN05192534_10817 [Alteribacillus persepolensis]